MIWRANPPSPAAAFAHSFGEGELKKQILFDVAVDIYPGEVVVLTGPSGSGQDDVADGSSPACATCSKVNSTCWGMNFTALRAMELVDVRRKIGFIFQAHNLLPFLSVRQNVELVFELHPQVSADEATRRATKMLQLVGLGDRLDYMPDKSLAGRSSASPSPGHWLPVRS